MKPRVLLVVAAVLVGLAATPCLGDEAPATSPHDVPEPQGLYQGPIHGYTPKTLKGGTVIDAAKLETLIKSAHPLLIDISDRDRKPPSMAPGMIWAPQHLSIPGAVWLPGAGNATSDAEFVNDFRTQAAGLTHGKRTQPVVVFCHPDCWASYNAAKRLVEEGYTKVYWDPGGIEGWQQAGLDLDAIKPDAAWMAGLPKALTQ